MPTRRPKVCLIFCGGSAMIAGDRVIGVRKAEDVKPWVENVPELELIADIEPVFLFGGDASEIEPDLWKRLAKEIAGRTGKYDGFVVTHGIDTMIYTSAMMAYMLPSLPVPVIFTGSPLSANLREDTAQDLSGFISSYKTLGVKANLINAIQVATMDLAEVAIMFGNRLIRATDATKTDAPSFNVFDAQQDGLIGKVDFGIKLFDHVIKRGKGRVRANTAMEPNVGVVQLYPGASASLIEEQLKLGKQGIVVRSFNTNIFPDTFKPILERAYGEQLPIVAHNAFGLEAKKKKREYILVNNMTFEATLVKFMWVLGQTRDLGEIRVMMWEEIF